MLLVIAGGPVVSQAQQALFVEYQGKAQLVRRVDDGRLYVADGGKLVPVRGAQAGLLEVREFLPYFVSVRKMRAASSFVNLSVTGGGSGEVNHTFEFHADFESPYRLENVFLVLELELESGRRIFYHGVGDLEPRRERHVSVYVPVTEKLGEGRFKLHLFANGGELLHSEQPVLFREQALDRMTARRIEGVTDASLRPFVGPAPEYPRALLKDRVQGQAVVKFRVTRTGAVVDPEVKTASDPVFGESALAAMRLWRFLPAVKEGRAVEARAEMPFQFEPPEPELK